MRLKFKYHHLAFIIAMVFIVSSCQKDDEFGGQQAPLSSTPQIKKKDNLVFYGPTVPVGNGVARAWISQDENGNPTAVGINLSEKALENLPDEDAQYVLFFPNHGATDFYTHVLMEWNPNGHEPPGIYDLPHFDFHFYIIPNEERLMIGPNDTIQFANAPASQYVPPDYLQLPGGVPQMGAHWIDLLSPEFHGQTFTKTFIWGSYDGEFIFWEPMITKAYLMSQPDEETTLRLPSAYARDGWYATSYTVKYTTRPNEYSIALTGLTWRDAQ